MLLDVKTPPDGAVTVMSDASDHLFRDGPALQAGHHKALDAASQLHRAHAGGVTVALCPLDAYYSFLSPAVCPRFAVDHGVPRLVAEGWERFHDVVPDDVSEIVCCGATGLRCSSGVVGLRQQQENEERLSPGLASCCLARLY